MVGEKVIFKVFKLQQEFFNLKLKIFEIALPNESHQIRQKILTYLIPTNNDVRNNFKKCMNHTENYKRKNKREIFT